MKVKICAVQSTIIPFAPDPGGRVRATVGPSLVAVGEAVVGVAMFPAGPRAPLTRAATARTDSLFTAQVAR